MGETYITPAVHLDPAIVSMDLVAVVEQLPDGLLLADSDGVVRLVNHRLEEMLGFARGELVGQPVEALLPEGVRDRHVGLRDSFISSPAVRPMGSGRELVARCKSGKLLAVEVSLSPLHGGDQPLIIAIVRDVTVQRQIAEERKRNADLFRALFDQAPIAMALTSLERPDEREILRANLSLSQLFGVPLVELRGQTIAAFTHPEERDTDTAIAQAMLVGGQPIVREKRYIRGDGTSFWGELHAVALADETGRFTQSVAHIIDIDGRKLAQSQRERQTRLWETLAAFSTDLFGDPAADVLRVLSTKAMELLEADAVLVTGAEDDSDHVEVRGYTGSIQVPSLISANALFGHLRGALNTQQAIRVELASEDLDPAWMRTPDGQVMTHAVLSPFETEAGSYVLSAFRIAGRDEFDDDEVQLLTRFVEHARLVVEVAERRRQERRMAVLEDRQRIARDLHDRVVGRLFATGLGLQGLISIGGPAVREQADRAVEEIDHAIADLRHAIFSLMHADERVTIGALRRLVRRTLAEKESLGFEIGFDGGGPDVVVDPVVVDHVMAVVNEAVVNAHRHARCTKVEVHLSNDADNVTLRVTDNGVGFTPGISPGNGLSSLLERARGLGGSCELDSTPGQGTSVVWQVPL
jgi:PAS domain S-box-containing protein